MAERQDGPGWTSLDDPRVIDEVAVALSADGLSQAEVDDALADMIDPIARRLRELDPSRDPVACVGAAADFVARVERRRRQLEQAGGTA